MNAARDRPGGTFVWPPRESADAAQPASNGPAPDETPPPGTNRRRVETLRRSWAEFERIWLDPIALPLAQRAEAIDWTPDAPAQFCARCGHSLGPYESAEFGCKDCLSRRTPWRQVVRLGAYAPPLSDWITEVKFTRWRALGIELGEELGRQAILQLGAALDRKSALIVPVPMSFRRWLERGIDHAAAIAHGMSQATGVNVIHPLRRQHTPSQRSVPASARQRNVARAFIPRAGFDLRSYDVILIDDVMTTGATMRACCRALRRLHAPPRSIVLALAAVTDRTSS